MNCNIYISQSYGDLLSYQNIKKSRFRAGFFMTFGLSLFNPAHSNKRLKQELMNTENKAHDFILIFPPER